jgi:hypothetical protein
MYCHECWDELANGEIGPNRLVRLPAQRCVPKPPSMVREWEEAQWYLRDEECPQKQRDFQRLAVYRWEWAVHKRWPDCNPTMDLRACENLVHSVWHDYRPAVQPPEVKSGRSRLVAKGGRLTITLPHWACTKLVVLHETAHSLQRFRPGHGPEFATFLLELWAHYAGVRASMAMELASAIRPRRVRFGSYADIPKQADCQRLAHQDCDNTSVAAAIDHPSLAGVAPSKS